MLTVLAAGWVLQLQRAALTKPWFYFGDALFYQGVVKGIVEHGYYLTNSSLGAPLGLHAQDFPLLNADLTQVLLVKFLGLVFSGGFAAANAFFLLTFPLVAVSACWALRHLGVTRAVAIVCGVLYAVLPYHFLRNVHHLFYSSYYTVPLIAVLVLDLLGGRPVFQARPDGGRLTRWATWLTARTVVFVLLIAVTSAYYAVFAVLLLASATLLRGLAERSWRPFLIGGLLTAGLFGVLSMAQLPTLLFQADHGKDLLVAQRSPNDSEKFGLKLDQMLLPVRDHRVPVLARLANNFEETTPLLSEATGNLGLVGSVGLTWLGVVALAAVVRARARPLGTENERHAGLMAIVAFVIATVGGISAVIAYTVSPQIRSWSRMSVVIAFFALLGAANLLDRVSRRSLSRPRQVVLAGGLALVLGVGVFDQTAPRYTPDYAGTTAQESVVHDFVARAMQVLPAGTAVLQLPYLPYPENGPINGMGDYEQIRPYLSSPASSAALRWSYGAVKGSPDDWLGAYSGGPLRLLLDVASVNGFGAIYVDQLAFKDRGAEVAAVLTAELGPAIARSNDDRMVMWDLGRYAAQVSARLDPQQRAAARQAGLHPTRGTMGVTFGAASAAMMTGRVVRDARPVAHVDLANDLKTGQRLALDVGLSRAGPSGTSAHLAFPDGTSLDVPLGDEPVRYIHVFTAPPGVSHIDLASVGGAQGTDRSPAPVVLKLVDPLLVPVDACLGRPLDTTVGACTTGPRPQVP